MNSATQPLPFDLQSALQNILNAGDVLAICQQTLAAVRVCLPYEHLHIYLVDHSRKRVTFEFIDGRVVGVMETNYKSWNNGLGGVAYRNRQIILLNADPGIHGSEPKEVMLLQDAQAISEMVIPLQVKSSPLGTIHVSQPLGAGRYHLEDIPPLQALAAISAQAIETTRLQESQEERRRMSRNLIQAGRQLAGAASLSEVPTHILAQLAVVVPYERGSLMMQEDTTLRIVAQRGFPDDNRVNELRISIREGDVYQQVAHGGRPVMIDDVTQITGWQQVAWLALNRSWMGVPLFSRDTVIGMISLTRRDAGAFSPEDSLLASTFALQAAIALENAELYDELTRLNQQLEEKVKQRTEELEKALTALERMDRHKSDFIRVAAHELRTPLTVMKGYTTMLESDPALRSQAYLLESLRGVLTGTDRLYEVVNSMLDVARIDNQILAPHAETVSLTVIARRVQTDLQKDLQERPLTLDVEDLSSLPHITGDSALLLKVFQNVLYNAAKFTPDGGQITVRGRQVDDKSLGACVEIQVQDTGIGIDHSHQELIFEKFYQTGKVELHSSGKTSFKGGGPGLGLAIARGIVQAHGGRIWVESAGCDEILCPGSCFHILLPITPPQ